MKKMKIKGRISVVRPQIKAIEFFIEGGKEVTEKSEKKILYCVSLISQIFGVLTVARRFLDIGDVETANAILRSLLNNIAFAYMFCGAEFMHDLYLMLTKKQITKSSEIDDIIIKAMKISVEYD